MAKYNTASLFSMLRERIGLERDAVLVLSNLDDSSLRRIEKGKQHPKTETLESIMKTIDIPLEGFIYSLLDNQPMEVYLSCDRLTQILDIGDTAAAEEIINNLQTLPGFDTGIPYQFLLSKKAQLLELKGSPSSQILPLIEAGMDETFEDFDENDITGKILVLEEPELLHTKARIYANTGKINEAIQILNQIISSLIKLPEADRDKEKQFAPVLLSLSKCLLQTENYEKVIEVCNLGADYSAIRKFGQFNPDFEFNKALALGKLDRKDECRSAMQHAYFGYMLLGETRKGNEVLKHARELFNIDLSLYGVDELDVSKQYRIPYSRGESVECNSIGTMIGALRLKSYISIEELCRGICDKSTLSRIELGSSSSNYFTLEAIMQRLGRDMNLYNNYFLSKEDFVAMQLRDRIYILVIEQKYTDASDVLNRLKTINSFIIHRVNQQFVKMIEALLFAYEHDELCSELPSKLLEALRITCPHFDERNIENYSFTYAEVFILNCYASYYGDIGHTPRAAEIYKRLLHNLNRRCVDEVEKAHMYSTIIFNYSMCIGRMERWSEALALITEGENFERNHKRLIELPGFAYNKGYVMIKLGNTKESIPYFALGYYGSSMFSKHGQESCIPIISKEADEQFGIVFD